MFCSSRIPEKVHYGSGTGIVKFIMIRKTPSEIIACHAKTISIHYSFIYRLHLAFKEK